MLVRAAAFDVLEPELLQKLHDAIFKEVAETSDFVKVGSSVPLLIALLSLQHIKHRCIESVLLLLKHPWPRIRSITAQQLFEFVIAHNSFVDEDTKFEKLTEILSITQWDGDSTAVDEGIANACIECTVLDPFQRNRVVALKVFKGGNGVFTVKHTESLMRANKIDSCTESSQRYTLMTTVRPLLRAVYTRCQYRQPEQAGLEPSCIHL